MVGRQGIIKDQNGFLHKIHKKSVENTKEKGCWIKHEKEFWFGAYHSSNYTAAQLL